MNALSRMSSGGIEPMLRLPEVKRATGVSKRTIYRWVKQGGFPRPVALGPGAVGWRESDIISWLQTRSEKPSSN